MAFVHICIACLEYIHVKLFLNPWIFEVDNTLGDKHKPIQ